MFTGIVETTARVTSVERRRSGQDGARRIRISCRLGGEPLTAGESISVDGVCQTAARILPDGFEADVMESTIRVTTLGSLQPGRLVNLERALRLGDRLGGHIVSGHVDGVGTVSDIRQLSGSRLVRITVPAEVEQLSVPKGSITVSGVSLTIVASGPGWLEVSLVQSTLETTTMSSLAAGSRVNLEADILGKYVMKFMRSLTGEALRARSGKKSRKTNDESLLSLLQEKGFM